jgi:DNA modification methylase
LRRCTAPGDIVLDLFGGSGSTLIACEQMKRSARLIELDPVFCDVILKRWEKLTGKKAILSNNKKVKANGKGN